MTIGETVGRRSGGHPAARQAVSPTLEPSPDGGLGDRLEAAVSMARRTTDHHSTLATVVLPIEPIDPIDLVSAANLRGLETRLWLRPADGFALVGIGAAWSIRPEGPDRFKLADAAWRELIAGSLLDAPAGTPSVTGPLPARGRASRLRRSSCRASSSPSSEDSPG